MIGFLLLNLNFEIFKYKKMWFQFDVDFGFFLFPYVDCIMAGVCLLEMVWKLLMDLGMLLEEF